MGQLKGEEGGGELPGSSSVELEEIRSISSRNIKVNKRVKGRFTKVVREVFIKRPE